MPKNKSQSNYGEVRIVAGQWRSRKLKVINEPGLRPTTDRVRETLFNWLQFDIQNSHCLDACAGSGALGFEALSRGAASVNFVESNVNAIRMLRENAQNLTLSDDQAIQIHHLTIEKFLASLEQAQHVFDIVFVDPPFDAELHDELFRALHQSQCLAEGALIYCEMPSNQHLELPQSWEFIRQKKLKNVSYALIAV